MKNHSLAAALSILVAMTAWPSRTVADPAGMEFFEKKIRPVLAEHCYECHSAGSKKLRGQLRLDSRAGLLQGGETGAALVPGKPEESLLYAAINHRDQELSMPPKKPKLPDSVIADFHHWIKEGALWPGQETPAVAKADAFDLEGRKQRLPWIWETPRRQTLPRVRDRDWPKDDLDTFILTKLEQTGLAPASPADDRAWLRRVCFAITGLPPSPREIHEFLADVSPQAREKVVDRLLASPHYGERWARHWMDLVRYAESRGHESDFIIANAYHYRDYLIRAFNADLPYDQFLLEQLAGDLLPRPRLNAATGGNESVLGTGWAFLGEEVHSPVDLRQDECDRIDNKVDVFTKTFLGLTVACARCHDHKFDAITAKDYYALTGFVLSSSYRQVRFETMEAESRIALDLESLLGRFRPNMAATAAASCRPGLERMADYLTAARRVLMEGRAESGRQTVVEAVAKEQFLEANKLQLWVRHLDEAAADEASPLHLYAKVARDPAADNPARFAELMKAAGPGREAKLPDDARVIADYSDPGHQPWKADGPGFGSRPLAPGDVVFGGDPAKPGLRVMTYGAACRDLFWNRLKTAPGNEDDSGSLAATSRSGQMMRTPTFTLGVGKLHYLIRGKTRVYAAVDSHLMVAGPLHGPLVATFNSGKTNAPQWLTHDLSAYSGHRAHLEFGPEGDGELEVLMVVEAKEKPEWRPGSDRKVAEKTADSPRALAVTLQTAMSNAAQRFGQDAIAGQPDAVRQANLANWFLQNRELLGGSVGRAEADLAADFHKERQALSRRVHWESKTAVAWFDGTGVDENVLVRGKPFRPGVVSPRSLPAAFAGAAPIHATSSSGRYDLGRQLVDPANPLVARVIVNRVWHHLFGRGIVATVDNFGFLGERPTHPELLDHLAWQFVHEDGWALKRLIRRLVLSNTYAMSSKPSDGQAEEVDPSNLLLHRMTVRRLEGEAIRDALLAVSGRLDPTLGGPPVPVYLTEFVVGRGRPEKSGPLDGAGRRSVYTAVRRNFLPTTMLAFDTPTPFSTVGRRNVTNVPAQSLVLMNDKLFYEQSRVWAQRLLREMAGAGTEERLRWLFETAYGRLPAPAEVDSCTATIRELQKLERAGTGPAEVWSELCHALLNANDFVYLR